MELPRLRAVVLAVENEVVDSPSELTAVGPDDEVRLLAVVINRGGCIEAPPDPERGRNPFDADDDADDADGSGGVEEEGKGEGEGEGEEEEEGGGVATTPAAAAAFAAATSRISMSDRDRLSERLRVDAAELLLLLPPDEPGTIATEAAAPVPPPLLVRRCPKLGLDANPDDVRRSLLLLLPPLPLLGGGGGAPAAMAAATAAAVMGPPPPPPLPVRLCSVRPAGNVNVPLTPPLPPSPPRPPDPVRRCPGRGEFLPPRSKVSYVTTIPANARYNGGEGARRRKGGLREDEKGRGGKCLDLQVVSTLQGR